MIMPVSDGVRDINAKREKKQRKARRTKALRDFSIICPHRSVLSFGLRDLHNAGGNKRQKMTEILARFDDHMLQVQTVRIDTWQ